MTPIKESTKDSYIDLAQFMFRFVGTEKVIGGWAVDFVCTKEDPVTPILTHSNPLVVK